MSFRTVVTVWDAQRGVLRVADRFMRVAQEQFRDGEEYPIDVNEKRSSKAHAFYFASVNAAWKNLRGETAEILSTPTHLRGWALIQAGYHHQNIVESPDRDTAIRMAVFARKLATKEGYVEIKVIQHDGKWYVRTREPKSQSRASMKADEFKESSRAVLDILSGAIEVTRRQLEREGRNQGEHG